MKSIIPGQDFIFQETMSFALKEVDKEYVKVILEVH